MKIASYAWNGSPTYGVVVGDGVVSLPGSSLRGALAGGLDGLLARAGAAIAGAAIAGTEIAGTEIAQAGDAAAVPLADVTFLPVIPDPAKILCIGLNYSDHREEASRDETPFPPVFFRFADTQIGHGQPAVRPASSQQFDYEGELAVVIGRPAHAVPESEAMSVVAGYSCYNDLSARDWQMHASQWGPGKNFPGTGAFGPWLVTADELADPAALHLTTRVNGEQRQDAAVADLIFSVPALIAYISAFTPLAPGDVIVTGTPAGVGLFRKPPTFLTAGDIVEVEISGIGTLRNVVADEATAAPPAPARESRVAGP
jgi:2-keto-4-pentenoate hydratase/2-oxohepta-3-ene-1,7-dioic acid hydratase in catechol pathway